MIDEAAKAAPPMSLRGKFLDHVRIVAWMVSDGIRYSKWRVLLICGLNLFGVVNKFGAFFIFRTFANALHSGRPVHVGRFTLPADNSLESLLIWGGIIAAAGVASALVTYLAFRLNLATARRYMVYCAARGLALLTASGPVRIDETGAPPSRGALLRMLRADLKSIMRTFWAILDGLAEVITLATAIVILVKTSPALTMVIGALFVLYQIPFYWINYQAMAYTKQREAFSQRAGRDLSLVVSRVLSIGLPAGHSRDWIGHFVDSRNMRGMADAFVGRILTRGKILLLSGAFLGICLATILVIFGMQERVNWGDLLIYGAALYFALGSLQKVAQRITFVNRFAPPIHRYAKFVRAYTRASKRPEGQQSTVPQALAEGECIIGAAPSRAGGPGSISLKAGAVVFCVAPASLNRYTFPGVCASLCTSASLSDEAVQAHSLIHGHAAPLPPITIQELVFGKAAGDEDSGRFHELLDGLGLRDEFGRLGYSLKTRLTPETESGCSRELRYALSAMPCFLTKPGFLFLDWRDFSLLSAEFRGVFLARVKDSIVFLMCCSAPPPTLPAEAAWAIAMDDKTAIGVGDGQWYAAAREIIATTCTLKAPAEADDEENKRRSSDDDDDDFDDE